MIYISQISLNAIAVDTKNSTNSTSGVAVVYDGTTVAVSNMVTDWRAT